MPKLPLRMDFYHSHSMHPRIKWTQMEMILGHFELKVEDFDFIGRSSALKRIGSKSSNLNSLFYRVFGHRTIYCEIANFPKSKNHGDFGYQFENACTPNAPPYITLYLATINEFRIEGKTRLKLLVIHEVDAIDENLNPIELKSTWKSFISRNGLATELQCAFAGISRVYVGMSKSFQNRGRQYMIVQKIEEKQIEIQENKALSGYQRMIAVLEQVKQVIKNRKGCNRFQLFAMEGSFVFGHEITMDFPPLRLTAETVQLFPDLPMPQNQGPNNKPKRKRKRKKSNPFWRKRKAIEPIDYFPEEPEVKIDYFPDENDPEKKKIVLDMAWMDKLPTKTLWDSSKPDG